MSDEPVNPEDQQAVPDPAAPTYESAAVDRARAALREPDDALTSVPEAVSGAIIGRRYKLLELIGEGGMGVVWMAEQRSPIRRLVAVKLIKAGMDSSAVLARFDAERQALAMMDHPNIARIFDGGTTELGHPFFVMELVKGLPLTRYCDERKMPVNARLDLFVQICGAVQHAHQKGIIHRDLKPGNLLVTEHDGKPVPKVIDFGLVKALSGSSVLTDRTLHTAYGAAAGTPLYMAPEQVAINALDVDTRTDVYALGVILYELLAGTTPHEPKQLHQAAWEEVRRVIRDVDPPRPSLRVTQSKGLPGLAVTRDTEPARLCKLIAGDLDWIVMKALEKDRHRRYGTASDLAADLQRHLAGEAVLAAPPTAAYRLRKFARKHRVALSTAAVILLVLIAGVLASARQAIRAKHAEAAAQRETIEAKDQKSEAERQKNEAQRQRAIAIEASKKVEAESATVQRQLADSYVQNGISAWDQHDPSLAALWFSKALKLDQGDAHRELMDRVRLGDSFRQCAWPSKVRTEANYPVADQENSKKLPIIKEPDGTLSVVSAHGARIKVNSPNIEAFEIGDALFISDKESSQLWDGATGRSLSSSMRGPYVSFAGSSSDHRFIVTSDGWRGWDWGILDARTGDSVALDDTKAFHEIRFSPDHKQIAVSTATQVRAWSLENLKPQSVPIDRAQTVSIGELNNNGKLVLTDNGEQWRVWNSDGTPVGPQFTGPYYENFSLVSPDGKRLLLKRSPGRYSLFDACSGTRLCDPTSTSIESLWFSKDGRSVGNAFEWDTRLIVPATSVLCSAFPDASAFKLSPDGKTLATCKGPLRLWDVETFQPLWPVSASMHAQEAQDAMFIANTGEIIAFQSDRERHRLIARTIVGGEVARVGPYVVATRWSSYANPIRAVSRDGNYILVLGWPDAPYEVFSTRTLQLVASIIPVGNRPASFSVDGRAVVGWDTEGRMAAWNVSTGEVMPNPPHEWLPSAVPGVLCPDGKSYLSYDYSVGYPDLRIFALDDGKALSPPFGTSATDDGYLSLSLGLNGAAVATQGRDSIRMWDARTAQAITSALPCDFYVRGAGIGGDGTSLISVSETADYSREILRRWSIAPTQFPAADCELLAVIISGREIDQLGGVVPEGQDTYARTLQCFIRLQRESPEMFPRRALPPSDVLPSYRDEVNARLAAAQTLEQKKSLAREWAYSGGLEIKSSSYKEAALLAARSLSLDDSSLAAKDHLAHAYACLGRFSEALAIYQKYAGQAYETDEPWAEKGLVGADLAELADIWPDGNGDPDFKQMLPLSQAYGGTYPNDAQRYADQAVVQFNLGHIPAAQDLLRKALRAGRFAGGDADTNAKLNSARSVIDPPSAQPFDAFLNGLESAVSDVVATPGQAREKYAAAAAVARHAVAIQADSDSLSVLGAAQFRAGDYRGALESLARSEAIDFGEDYHVRNLIFSAMAQHQMGRREEARALLGELIDLAKKPNALSVDDKPLFNEAAAMIDPASAPANSDPQRMADEAVAQFKVGRIEESHDLLRKAVRAAGNAPSDDNTGTKIFSARSLIDPPSTQPTDSFASSLADAAWDLVKTPGQPPARCAIALDVVSRSVAIEATPYNLNTLGAAQFRAGDYKGALASLARSEAMDFVAQENLVPNLAFSAMAQEKLGRHDLATALLQKLIDLAKEPNAIAKDDYQKITDEATAMIDPASTQPTTKPTTAP